MVTGNLGQAVCLCSVSASCWRCGNNCNWPDGCSVPRGMWHVGREAAVVSINEIGACKNCKMANGHAPVHVSVTVTV